MFMRKLQKHQYIIDVIKSSTQFSQFRTHVTPNKYLKIAEAFYIIIGLVLMIQLPCLRYGISIISSLFLYKKNTEKYANLEPK